MILRKGALVFSAMTVLLTGCSERIPAGKASFVYMSEKRDNGLGGTYELVEYYPHEQQKAYINREIDGLHYRNSYYDGTKLYLSLSHKFLIYDSTTKQVKQLEGTVGNAIKKINGEIWFGLDNGFGPDDGYAGSLCKLNEEAVLDCLYELKNQRPDDFYFDLKNQVFFVAGPGVGETDDESSEQYKVMKYDMRTGAGESVRNNGQQILAGRLTNICPGQFITSDGDIYQETGEKIGEVLDRNGAKLNAQVNDLIMNTTVFIGHYNKSFEVYGCENNNVTHLKTIELSYEANLYPVYFSWETTDDGEISMPIESKDEFFDFIGFQSVNTRTGEVQVHLFDEPVYRLHSIARFV